MFDSMLNGDIMAYGSFWHIGAAARDVKREAVVPQRRTAVLRGACACRAAWSLGQGSVVCRRAGELAEVVRALSRVHLPRRNGQPTKTAI